VEGNDIKQNKQLIQQFLTADDNQPTGSRWRTKLVRRSAERVRC
jgi:hypothetical protein